MSLKLKRHLFQTYQFTDERIQNVQFGDTFVVDSRFERQGTDPATFCSIFLKVHDHCVVDLHMHRNTPLSKEIRKLVASRKGTTSDREKGSLRVRLNAMNSEDIALIRQLANEVEKIAKRDRHVLFTYQYEFSTIAASLRKLAATLQDFNPYPLNF